MFLMTGAATTFDIGTAETISDNIQDDSAASLPGGTYTAGSGTGAAITKQGAGTLILSGTNTYTGGTTVNAGTLQVDGSIGDATVNGGSTLSGTGTVANVTLNSAGIIAPGDSPGALHGTSLAWNGGGSFNFQLGATNSTIDSDQFALTGTLTKGSAGTFMFHFSDGNGAPTLGTTYTLITFTSNAGFVVGDFSFDYSGANAGLTGNFVLTSTALQFAPTALPVRLQSFEVD
jgi:autotransporter-associated beta strand protein